jgi:hypothetical protein
VVPVGGALAGVGRRVVAGPKRRENTQQHEPNAEQIGVELEGRAIDNWLSGVKNLEFSSRTYFQTFVRTKIPVSCGVRAQLKRESETKQRDEPQRM